MRTAIRLMVVDDHPLARHGLISMLHAHEERFQVVAEAEGVQAALQLAEAGTVEIVLTDLHFEPDGSPNGLDLLRRLKAQQPGAKVVMITSEMSDQFLLEAFDAGADAYLHKHAASAEIVRAIESVASGFTHFPAHLRKALEKREREPRLTPREIDVLPYIARGMTAKEIARELMYVDPLHKNIASRTIEVHKANIKQRLHLEEANSLIPFAIEYCQAHRIDFKAMMIHTRPNRPDFP